MSSHNSFKHDFDKENSDGDDQDPSVTRSYNPRTREDNSMNPVTGGTSDYNFSAPNADTNRYRRGSMVNRSENELTFRSIVADRVDRDNDQTRYDTTDHSVYRSQNHLRGSTYAPQMNYETWDKNNSNLDATGWIVTDPIPGYQDPYSSNHFKLNFGSTGRAFAPTQSQHGYIETDADPGSRFPRQHIPYNTKTSKYNTSFDAQIRQTLPSPLTERSSKTQFTGLTRQVDRFEDLRSVVIRTTRPIRDPYDIDSYFKKLFRHHQIIENMLMDSFEGVVYVTFNSQQDAQHACEVTHDPESSNISEIWIPRKEDIDFLNDGISIYGECVSHPDFKENLIQMVRNKTGHIVLCTIQTDCPASMLIRVNNSRSLIELSRLLVAISMELDVGVAPVKKCFMISVRWDQRKMHEAVVLDYIHWKNDGVQIKSVNPFNSGVILEFDDEKVIFAIISEGNHEILGRPLQIEYYHPCLTLETYQKKNLNLRRANPHHHQIVANCGLPSSHLGYTGEFMQVPRNTMDRNELHISHFNQLSTLPPNSRSSSESFRSYGAPCERNSREFDPDSSNFTSEDREELRSSSPPDPLNRSMIRTSFSSSTSLFSEERQNSVPNNIVSGNLVKQHSNPNTSEETLTIEIEINELQLLFKTKFIEKLQKQLSNLKFVYERDLGKITVFGDAHISKLAKYEILEHVQNQFVSYDLSGLREEELQIFKMDGFAEQINEDFDKSNIAAYMSCVNDNPTVMYEKNEGECKIEKTIKRFVTLEEYTIDPNKILMYQSKQWNSFLEKLKSEDAGLEYSTIKVDQSKTCILLVGSSHMQFIMKKKLEEFDGVNSRKDEEVVYDNTLQEYTDRFFINEIQNIKVKTRELGAEIKQIDGAFILEGLEEGLKYGERELKKLRDSIKTKQQTLDYPGCSEFLQATVEEERLHSICSKYSCLIKLSEQGAIDDSSDDVPEDTLTNIAWDFINKCKISVTKGDPEKLTVNRILNFIKSTSSNYTDMPKGFVGGPDAWNKIKSKMLGSAGENLETTGEKNRDLKIQHFVCNNEEKTLSESLKLGFNKASTTKCQSIAIAIDGMDNLEIKQEQSSKLIAQSVTKQLKVHPSPFLKDIFICGNNEVLLKKIAVHLGFRSPQNNSASSSQESSQMKLKKKTSAFKCGSKDKSSFSSRPSVASDTKTEIVFKPIDVKLISGDILTETADVLVTSVQEDLDMASGRVLRSVLIKGGEEIQQELKQKYPSGIDTGAFAVSGGGKLPFKRIYYACLPHWDTSSSGDQIKQLINNLLEEADKELLTSITLSALGTDNPSYESDITCCSILSAIEDFAKNKQQTTLRSVKLVVFTTDNDIMKEYGQAIFKYSSPSLYWSETNPSVVASSPYKKPMDSFSNIVVQLTSGDITCQKTKAIVVSVDGSLDLRKGKVANAILKNGGQSIQTELTQKFPNGLQFFEYGKTSSGNLVCKEIFFVCLPSWNKFDKKKMKKLILTILSEIEATQGTTVSFPAFGTGNLGYPPQETQNFTISSLRAFAIRNPQYLRTVEIVVHPYDTIIYQAFCKGLNMPLSAASAQASLQMITTEKKESSGLIKKIISALTSPIGYNVEKSTETIFKVGTVTLTVKKGDITEEMCDTFVTAVRDDMDLATSGTVSYQILQKCDNDFIKRCQQQASDLKLYGLTSVDVQAGNLNCKEVFFINMSQYSNQWDIGIEKVLKCADKKGFTTLALPTFTAAHPDTDTTKLIQQIKGAITNFGNDNPKSLTDVRLIVNDKDMLKAASEQTQGTLYSGSVILKGEDKELSENAHVILYYTEESKVKRAMEEFMKLCSSRHTDFSCKSSSIKQFTDFHFKNLKRKGFKNMIKVTYNKDEGMISMAGFGDLAKIQAMVNEIEKEIQKQMLENLGTDTSVHWQYEVNDMFIDFSNVLNIQLEADFKGKKHHALIDMDDQTYIVDFGKQTMSHKDTGDTMSIKRKDALEAGEPIPKHWEKMSINEPYKLVSLPTDSDEYKEVAAYYRIHGATGHIYQIERVQNRALYQQFIAKKREVENRNPGNNNELFLFHGSDFRAVNDINKTGFNRSYCGKNATVYGQGVYFAQSSAYSEQYASPDANGMCRLYQAQVLVGVSIETDSSTKFLPKQPGTDIPYDSGRAPASRKEGIHIIFHDSQAYPEYIITFSLPLDHVAK